MTPSSRLRISLVLLSLVASAPAAAKEKWKPITPEELALKASTIDKDAGAEAIFWERRVEDGLHHVTKEPRTVTTHYVRVKIFDERGQKAFTQIEIPYDARGDVSELAARTIKSDGSIVELSDDAVFERSLAKTRKGERRVKAFAPPALAPGVLIEYQWKELAPDKLTQYVEVEFQREVPVQRVTYGFKPLAVPGYVFRTRAFRCDPSPFKKDNDQFLYTTVLNQPAFKTEPYAPPTSATRAWMLIFYTNEHEGTPDSAFKSYSEKFFEYYKPRIKPKGDVKKLADAAVAGKTDPEEKLRALWDLSRARVKRLADATADERRKIAKDATAADVLDAGTGSGDDVNVLFASLAQAAGFDVRMAAVGDRQRFLFMKEMASGYFLPSRYVAVKVDGAWRFFAPGDRNLPWGRMRWENENEAALVSDPKNLEFVKTPASPADRTFRRRTATFELLEDGTLEGTVRSEHHGAVVADLRDDLVDETADAREKSLREGLEQRLPGIELTNVKIEGLDVVEGPIVYEYRARIPGYAARTGKRLLVNPSYFRKGGTPRFTAAERQEPVLIAAPESDDDTVTIKLPKGFAAEETHWGVPIEAGKLGSYRSSIAVTDEGRTLTYVRKLRIKAGFYPVESYLAIRDAFDRFNQRDAKVLALQERATP